MRINIFILLKARPCCFGLLLFTFLFTSFSAFAQNTSNKGTDFWVVYAGHLNGPGSSMFLYLTSEVSTTATVTLGNNTPQTVSIAANAVTVVPIDPNLAHVGTSEVIEKKGIHVNAEKPIVVYSHIFIGARSAASIVLPTTTMGREYYAMAYTRQNTTGMSEFTIIGVEDGTTIEITPKATAYKILAFGGTKTTGHPGGTPYKIVLDKGEVYQVQSNSDLTGSRIHTNVPENATCKKIAVFSGDSFAALGCSNAGTADNLYQQLYPVSTWGKNFVTAPFINRPNDIYRILVAEDNTVVSVNGSTTTVNGTPLSNPYQKGALIEFVSSTANVIAATRPVCVAQFAITMGCDPRNAGSGNNNAPFPGDPDMIILNPVEQTVSSSTLYSALRDQTNPATNITQHYINLVMKAADAPSLRIDGNKPAATFTPIPNTEYVYLQEDVTASSQSNPTHNLVADGGFNAIAYGYGQVESYGYSAGANVKDLTKFITPLPEAGPAYTSGCAGASVSFSVTLPYAPTSMVWDFGDGSSYTETDLSKRTSPTRTYPTAGTYLVKLTAGKPVSNDCDTQDEVTFSFTVNENPKADFSLAAGCAKNATTFKDLSAATGGSLAKWEWEFEPGKKSSQQHPSYVFANPGTFRVKLKVTTNGGCTDTISRVVTIRPLPRPAFQAAAVCETFATQFADQSSIVSGTVADWRWDFGDGSPRVSTRNPAHTYQQPGVYQVKLVLASDQGCRDSLTQAVTVHPRPKAAYQLPQICLKDVAVFSNKSTISGGSISSYKWYFGDGATATTANPSHRYAAEGTYQVKLVVTSDNGCRDSLTTAYVVSGAEPLPDFRAASFCRKDSVSFTDASSIAFGKIIRWRWHFGDGNTSSLQHPRHRYARAGTYTVKMVAYSGGVCRDSVSKTITVIESPDAAFTTDNICLGTPTPLVEASVLPGGQLSSFRWDFGDGSPALSGRQPGHTYAQAGTYTITLRVQGSNGCSDQMSRQITVYPKPMAAFTATNFCEKDAVAFTDGATVASGQVQGWRWDFGDGSTSSQQHPSHTYKAPGTYAVTLQVTTDRGCQASVTQPITVSALPQASAGADQLGLCGVTSVVLQGNVPPAGQGSWQVVSGTGGALQHPNLPQATFSGKMNETYTLRWTVRNAPCPDASDDVQVRFNPIPAAEAGPGADLIAGESLTLQGSGEGTFSWSPAAGLSSTSLSNPVASPEVTTLYTLTVTSAAGCQQTDTVRVKVLEKLRIPNAFSPNNDGVNDNWVIGGIQDYPKVTIEVFDRWGGKVYAGGYREPWDGKRNGIALPMGTYYYVINQHNGRKPFSGPISLIR